MKKNRPARSADVTSLPPLMTDMLSRTRFDMRHALNENNREALKTAAERCARCSVQAECQQWIAHHQEGENNPVPSFCPNAPYIRSNGS